MNEDRRKFIEKVYERFPGIFKPQLKTACLYFNDRNIYPKALYIIWHTDNLAYFASNDDELYLYVEFDPDCGILSMVDDFNLGVGICVKLFEVCIDITYISDKVLNVTSYYDKEAIMRRHKIKNIIENE